MSVPAVAKACERMCMRLKTERTLQRVSAKVMKKLGQKDGQSVYCQITTPFNRADILPLRERMLSRWEWETFPGISPRIISGNGLQFAVREFKGFIRLAGMTNARTGPFQPQSNGKLERRNSNLEEAGCGGLRLDSPQTECYIHRM